MAKITFTKLLAVLFLGFAVASTSFYSFDVAATSESVASPRKKSARSSNSKTTATYCGPKCRASRKKSLQKLPSRSKAKRSCDGHPSPKGFCPDLEDDIVQAKVGGSVKCWSKLFFLENGCGSCAITAAQGNNPHHGWGLCTLESSYALRKRRGGTCAKPDISSIHDQIKCCAEMMAAFGKRNSYFGPVRRGKVAKCK